MKFKKYVLTAMLLMATMLFATGAQAWFGLNATQGQYGNENSTIGFDALYNATTAKVLSFSSADAFLATCSSAATTGRKGQTVANATIGSTVGKYLFVTASGVATTFIEYASTTQSLTASGNPPDFVTAGGHTAVTKYTYDCATTTNLTYLVFNAPVYVPNVAYGLNPVFTNASLLLFGWNSSGQEGPGNSSVWMAGFNGNASTQGGLLTNMKPDQALVNPFVAEGYFNTTVPGTPVVGLFGNASTLYMNSTGSGAPLKNFFAESSYNSSRTGGVLWNGTQGAQLNTKTDLFSSASLIACNGAAALYKISLKQDNSYICVNGTGERLMIGLKLGTNTYEYLPFSNTTVMWVSPFDMVATLVQNSTTASGNYKAYFTSNGSVLLYPVATSISRLEDALTGSPSYALGAGSTGSVSLVASNGSLQGVFSNSDATTASRAYSAAQAVGTLKVTDAAGPAFYLIEYQDTDYDGYINYIYLKSMESLDTMSLAVTDFLVIDYSKGSNAGNTIHPSMFVNATAVAAASTTDTITGNDAIQLTFADTEIKTGDYVRVSVKTPDGFSLAQIKDASSNAYNPYLGDASFDVLQLYYFDSTITASGATKRTTTVESDYYQTKNGITYYPGVIDRTGTNVGAHVVDRAAPAPTNASMTGTTTIDIAMSEPITFNGTATILAGQHVSDYFVMLDGSNATILDVTDWGFNVGTNQTVCSVRTNALGGTRNTNASQVSVLFLSQTGASIDANGSLITDNATDYTNNWQCATNMAGGADKTTYNPYRTIIGTLIPVANALAPSFDDANRQAVALWSNGGYSTILAYITEEVNATTPSDTTAPNALASNFYVFVNDSNVNTVSQKLHPASVTVSSSAADTLIVTLPYTALAAETGAMTQAPVWLQYVNPTNSTSNGTSSFIVGYSSGRAMVTDCCTIQSLYSDRNASVRAVEIAGTLKNFTSVAGARIMAYQLYKYLTVSDVITLDITFEYGPLASATTNAFGITAKQSASQTNDDHAAGNYAGIHIKVDGAANVNCTLEQFVHGGGCGLSLLDSLKQMINQGMGYLHATAGGGAAADMYLSLNATAGGNDESVFPIEFTKNSKSYGYAIGAKNLKYNMKVSGTWTTVTGYRWLPVGNTGNIADLNPATYGGTAAVAGLTVLPFDMSDDNASFKCVAVDLLGDLINSTASRFNSKTGAAESLTNSALLTSAETTVLSSITDTKWVFVLQKNDGTRVLLNGVTPEVAIDKYFWAVDGPQLYNFNYNQIYNYTMSNATWNLLPLAWDKTYSTKTSGTTTFKVNSISDAMIGLTNSYVPVVAPYTQTVFALDKNNGATLGAAKDVTTWNGGYAIAFLASDPSFAAADNGTIFNPASMWTFGYNINNMTGADFDDDYRLSTNVIDITENDTTKSDSARTSANKNLGWNLLANVQAYTLSSTTNVDYVVTFESGEFKSWIDGLNSDLDDLSNAMTSGGGTSARVLGKAYFVHTEKK